jgi:SAM-dependent methyltransferase
MFHLLFERLARHTQQADWWTFMNYGYAENGHGQMRLGLPEQVEPERYCIQLYHRVAEAIDLAGLDVAEISAGRGGGAAHVCRVFQPRSMTGIDIAPSAIAFCRRVHRLPNLRFIQGDAEDLPLFDQSVDAVINIEASFCYGDIDRFFAEVRRVLRPGGYFLYADLRLHHEVDELLDALRRSGMAVVDAEDITANVVRALELDDQRRSNGIVRHVAWPFRGMFRTFAGTTGTRMPILMQAGEMQYLRFVLRRPLEQPIPLRSACGRTQIRDCIDAVRDLKRDTPMQFETPASDQLHLT